MEEVCGSIPHSSTTGGFPAALPEALRRTGFALGGVVAGEGCFTTTRNSGTYADGSPRPRFVFALEMSEPDAPLVQALQAFLQAGSVRVAPPRRDGWLPSVTLTVNSLTAHLRATIPFADVFLPPSAKRRQYLAWRTAIDRHLEVHPLRWGRGPSACQEPDCTQPVRGRGLCRRHYYLETGY